VIYTLRIILTALVVFIIQVTFAHKLAPQGAEPDLIMVMLIVLVFDRKPVTAIIIGFLLGFLQDLGNASYLGMNALAKSIVAYATVRYVVDYLPDNILFKGLLIFVSSLVSDIIVLNVMGSFNPLTVITAFLRYSILAGLYTAVIGMIVFKVLEHLPGRTVRARVRY
jgi:rod shape-determining protein MreD